MDFQNYKLATAGSRPIIEIIYLNDILDLHNACEFVGLEYNVKENTFFLFWKYYYKYTEVDIKDFKVIFENVQSLKILPRDNEIPFYEDESIREIIYNDGVIAFHFMGGMEIEIEAASTLLRMEAI